MPRQTTKTELVSLAEDNFLNLQNLIKSVTVSEANESGVSGEWSVKDVLAHLHEWHNMVSEWEEVGRSGAMPEIPGKGYSWKQTPELNADIYHKYKDYKYSDVLKLLNKSHQKMMKIINEYDEDGLFKRSIFPWTGKNAVGAYFISATSSHYDWASKLIKKWLKAKQ